MNTSALKTVAVAAAFIALPSLGIARVQPNLARTTHDVKQQGDVYLLPPPDELRTMTLGYRAAAADYLWAKLLVEYGTHWAEKREWRDAPKYLDAILALEPSYPLVFRYADTLLVYRPLLGTEEDARLARKYLERGTRERPWDHEAWMHYGQFIAFTSPTFLPDAKEVEQWRKDGAEAMFHAVELGGHSDRAVSAATLLGRSGQRDAAIRDLERAWTLTDDPDARADIERKLGTLRTQGIESASQAAVRFVENGWRKDYPFLPRDAYLLLGPASDAYACAGRNPNRPREACPRSWDEALPPAARPRESEGDSR